MPYQFLHGFSLIEVLVSLLLLSSFLIIFNASNWSVLRENRANYYFHIAILQSKNIAERLRALNQHGGFESQIVYWQDEVKQLLPNGRGFIFGQYPHITLSVVWGEHSDLCQQNQIGVSGCLREDITL